MATVSYGTITVTDLTDITDVYLEYCMAEAGLTASQVEAKTTWVSPEVEWSTTYPTWQSGYEIWIRQVQKKEGIDEPEYGTPYLDTAVNQINDSIGAINNSIYTISTNVTGLDNRLKAFFWPGDSSYSGAFAVAKTSDDGLDVSNANTYGFNTRVATGLVSIGYNKIPLSEWGINEGLKMYYPISDNGSLIDNKLGMQLTANTLNLYNPTLSYTEYNGKTENENPRELRLYEYSTSDNVYILTTDTTFNESKTYYENDVIKGLEIDGTGMIIYGVDEKPVITAKNTMFSLGFDLANLSNDFDPYSAGNENPFIVWQKKENVNYLYEFLDDIIIKDSQRDSQRYSLKQEIDIIENNIATNASDINNIISNHIPLINSNISKIDNLLNLANNNISTNTSNISTNANNISINASNISIINAHINKIKAYWKIDTNNHLILIEEGL